MAVDILRERGAYVAELSSAIADGAGGLRHIPGLLRRVLENDGWSEFITLRDELRTPETFAEFVTAPPLGGLGADIEQLMRLVNDDDGLQEMVRDAASGQHGGDRHSARFKVHNINLEAPRGTSKAYAMRRLREEAPELHAEVIARRLSPHAAMVRAGLRPKTATVRVADPEAVARTLRRAMTAADLARLRQLLEQP